MNCVEGEKGFKAMKMLVVCLILERIQSLQTQNDKHFCKEKPGGLLENYTQKSIQRGISLKMMFIGYP